MLDQATDARSALAECRLARLQAHRQEGSQSLLQEHLPGYTQQASS
jgi:hypothetical protein